ncbi:thermonuclease family protein [Siccirubricoccus deserti]
MLLGMSWLAMPVLAAEPLIGRASVIDGDTIEIHGQRIRIHGIDAPEVRQPCVTAAGHAWRCGRQAALKLAAAIGDGPVRCEPRSRDRFRRVVAVCWRSRQDLGAWMVANGWAVASHQYSSTTPMPRLMPTGQAGGSGPAASRCSGTGAPPAANGKRQDVVPPAGAPAAS